MNLVNRTVVVLGFALFAMFFGAGNLIFPPTLGRIFGDQFAWSTLGFLLTGVGLPLMGVLSVAWAEGGIDHLARKVDPRLAKVLSIIIILIIGPLFAIPRTCATTFELGIVPNIPWLGSWPFSFIYFGAVLFFALNPLSVVDRIGKILTPLLLTALVIMIAKGVFDPIALPAAASQPHAFGASLVEGYQTMDLLAATIFGIIILNELRSKGIFEKRQLTKSIVVAGLIAAAGLAIVYAGLLYLGATTSSLPGELTRTALLHTIARDLLGPKGCMVLGVAVSMACLTTAIGLTVVCGEYFNKLAYGRLNYKAVCIVVAGISLVLSNIGVESIVKLAVPPLVALYPVVMSLVILCLMGEWLANRNIWRGVVIGAFLVGIVEALRAMGVDAYALELVYGHLPLTEHGVGWLLPSVIFGGVGALIREKPPAEFRVLVICPSQLATRVAIFDDSTPVFETAIPHQLEQVMSAKDWSPQLKWIREEINRQLTAECIDLSTVNAVDRSMHSAECIDLSTVNAVAARGGFTHPLPGGTYRVTEAMITDLEKYAWRQHPSNWGVSMAYEIAIAHDIDAYIVDPVVVDEMSDLAHYSGIPEVKRTSIFHASNQKAVVRRAAKNLWKRYDQINAIVAHMGEGTSVGAHMRGRVIDVNNALDGDGPFSALNAGSLPTVDVVRMCFEPQANEEGVLHRIRSAGGLLAYLGTADAAEIGQRLKAGDEKVQRVIDAMGYQVSKEIGSLAAALSGRVDFIALTGELAAIKRLAKHIKSRVRFLAPVFVYPGESETSSLVAGVLRVLRGEEEALEYEPLET